MKAKILTFFYIYAHLILGVSSSIAQNLPYDPKTDLIFHKYFMNGGEKLKITIKNLDKQPPLKIKKLIKLKDPTPLQIGHIEFQKSPYLQDFDFSNKLSESFIKMGKVVSIGPSFYQYIYFYPVVFDNKTEMPISCKKLSIEFSKTFTINRPHIIKKDYRLLLLVAEKFRGSKIINDYVLHKKQMGLTIELKYISPNDEPEQIKTFIINSKRNWVNPSLRYIVIIGTSQEVRTLKLVDRPSDYFYQHIDISKEVQSNDKNAPPDVSLGRIPLSDLTSLTEHLEHLIKYERGNFKFSEWLPSENFFKILKPQNVFNFNGLPYILSDALIPGTFVDKENEYSEVWLLDPYGHPHFFGGNKQSYHLKETLWNNTVNKKIYSTSDLNEIALSKHFDLNYKRAKGSLHFYEIYNLLGDPSIQFFTDTPQKFNVTISSPISRGKEIKIKILNEFGQNVPYASVYIRSLTSYHFEKYYFSDSNGEVIIKNTINFPLGEYEVNIKLLNFKLFNQKIKIEDQEGSLINIEKLEIIKDERDNTTDPHIIVKPIIKNIGNMMEFTTFGVLKQNNFYIKNIEPNNNGCLAGSFIPGREYYCAGTYKISLDPQNSRNLPSKLPVMFYLSDDNKTYLSECPLKISPAVFELSKFEISSNGEKIFGDLLPGKKYELNVLATSNFKPLKTKSDIFLELKHNSSCISISKNKSPPKRAIASQNESSSNLLFSSSFVIDVEQKCKHIGNTEFQLSLSDKEQNKLPYFTFIKKANIGENIKIGIINNEKTRSISNGFKQFYFDQSLDFNINNISLCLNVESRDFKDFELFLTSPLGKKVILHKNQAIDSESLNGCFNKDLKPFEMMEKFSSETPKGKWTLTVKADKNLIDFKSKGFTLNLEGNTKENHVLHFNNFNQTSLYNNNAVPGKSVNIAFSILNIGNKSGTYYLYPPKNDQHFEILKSLQNEFKTIQLNPGEVSSEKLEYELLINENALNGDTYNLIIPYRTNKDSTVKNITIPITINEWDYRIHLAGLENLSSPDQSVIRPGDILEFKYRIQNLANLPSTKHFFSVESSSSPFFEIIENDNIISLSSLEEKIYSIKIKISPNALPDTQLFMNAIISNGIGKIIKSKNNIGVYIGNTFNWTASQENQTPFSDSKEHKTSIDIRNKRTILGLKVFTDLDTDTLNGIRLSLIAPDGTSSILLDFHDRADKIHGVFGKDISFHNKLDIFQNKNTEGKWSLLIEKKSPLTYIHLKKWSIIFHTHAFKESDVSLTKFFVNDIENHSIPVPNSFSLSFSLKNEGKDGTFSIDFPDLPPYLKKLSTVGEGCNELNLNNQEEKKCSGYYFFQISDPKYFGHHQDFIDLPVLITGQNFSKNDTIRIPLSTPQVKFEKISVFDVLGKKFFKIPPGKDFFINTSIINESDYTLKDLILHIEYNSACVQLLSGRNNISILELNHEKQRNVFQFRALDKCPQEENVVVLKLTSKNFTKRGNDILLEKEVKMIISE